MRTAYPRFTAFRLAEKRVTSNDDYVLQVAFAREPEAAQALLERLAAGGYQVFIYEVDRGDKGLWYKVLIGPFVEKAEAEAMAARLKAEEKLTAIVSKR